VYGQGVGRGKKSQGELVLSGSFEVGRSGQGNQASDQPDIFYDSKAAGSV